MDTIIDTKFWDKVETDWVLKIMSLEKTSWLNGGISVIKDAISKYQEISKVVGNHKNDIVICSNEEKFAYCKVDTSNMYIVDVNELKYIRLVFGDGFARLEFHM